MSALFNENYSKMKLIYSIVPYLGVLLLIGCNPCCPDQTVYAEKVLSSNFKFFDEGLIDKMKSGNNKKDSIVYAEVSAVTYDGEKLIFGNEYLINRGLSDSLLPIFAKPYKNFPTDYIEFYDDKKIMNAKKFEDMTMLVDDSANEYVMATTAFNRDTKDEKGFNTLLIWPKDNPKKVEVVHPSDKDSLGIISSLKIREELINALAKTGAGYIKIEGLAAIPNNKLLFGIRELGGDYDSRKYTITIISADYMFYQDKLVLHNFQIALKIDPEEGRKKTNCKIVGLSSLEYDSYNKRLYMLTSYESDRADNEKTYEDIGAYLWVSSIDENDKITTPKLVIDKATSKPLVFNHKAEGIAVISATELFVVHDDDTVVEFKESKKEGKRNDRKPNQSYYTKLKIEN